MHLFIEVHWHIESDTHSGELHKRPQVVRHPRLMSYMQRGSASHGAWELYLSEHLRSQFEVTLSHMHMVLAWQGA